MTNDYPCAIVLGTDAQVEVRRKEIEKMRNAVSIHRVHVRTYSYELEEL